MVFPVAVSNLVALGFSSACTLLGVTSHIIERRRRQSSGDEQQQQTAVERRLTAVRSFLMMVLPPSSGLLAHSTVFMITYYGGIRPGLVRDGVEAFNVWVSFSVAVFIKLVL